LNGRETPVATTLKACLKRGANRDDTFKQLFTIQNRKDYSVPETEEFVLQTKQNLVETYKKLEGSRIERFQKNSVEYVAMVDALRDLSAVMQNSKAKPEEIAMLQARAYIKCDYYQKNRTPLSSMGRMRKNEAIQAMKQIESINHHVRQDILTMKGNELLTEFASVQTKKMMGTQIASYTNVQDALQDSEELSNCLLTNMRDNGLKQLSEKIHFKNGGAFSVFEKMCQKEYRVLFRSFMADNAFVSGMEMKDMSGSSVEQGNIQLNQNQNEIPAFKESKRQQLAKEFGIEIRIK